MYICSMSVGNRLNYFHQVTRELVSDFRKLKAINYVCYTSRRIAHHISYWSGNLKWFHLHNVCYPQHSLYVSRCDIALMYQDVLGVFLFIFAWCDVFTVVCSLSKELTNFKNLCDEHNVQISNLIVLYYIMLIMIDRYAFPTVLIC